MKVTIACEQGRPIAAAFEHHQYSDDAIVLVSLGAFVQVHEFHGEHTGPLEPKPLNWPSNPSRKGL